MHSFTSPTCDAECRPCDNEKRYSWVCGDHHLPRCDKAGGVPAKPGKVNSRFLPLPLSTADASATVGSGVQTFFWQTGFRPFQSILTKTAKMTNMHSVHRNKGFAPQTPENYENDETRECHAREDLTCQNPFFFLIPTDSLVALQQHIPRSNSPGRNPHN